MIKTDSSRTQDTDHYLAHRHEEHPAMRRQRTDTRPDTDRHLLSGRTLRATQEEWEAWLEDAQLSGLTFQDWARRVLNQHIDFVPKLSAES
jgi:hypothetical protein